MVAFDHLVAHPCILLLIGDYHMVEIECIALISRFELTGLECKLVARNSTLENNSAGIQLLCPYDSLGAQYK